MKKLIILLLSISTQAYAISYPTLRVSVKNDTPSSCYLVQKVVKSGMVTKQLPYKIKSGATNLQLEIEEIKKNQGISVLLSYECGDNRSISLLSTNSIISKRNTTQGSIVKQMNLSAVSVVSDAGRYQYKPSAILWTIS